MSSGVWRCGVIPLGPGARCGHRACWRTSRRCWSWRWSWLDPDAVITLSFRFLLVAPSVRCERPSAPVGGDGACRGTPTDRGPRWSVASVGPVVSSKDTTPTVVLSHCTYTLCMEGYPMRCRIAITSTPRSLAAVPGVPGSPAAGLPAAATRSRGAGAPARCRRTGGSRSRCAPSP